MSIRRLAQNLLLSITVLLTFAVLAEGVLQIAVPLLYRPRFTKLDSVVGWRHHTSVSTMSTLEGHTYRESYNSHGFRPPERSFAKPPGTRRIIVLGDSFVDGSEVGDEELFTWHLEEAMPGVEVINLGVYGYSTAQELLTLEETGLRYDPDLVVVVTLPNDFTGNTLNFNYFGPAPRFVLDADSLRYQPTTARPAREAFRATNLPAPGMAFLHRHSLAYYFLNHFIYQKLAGQRIQELNEAQIRSVRPAQRHALYRRLIGRMQALATRRGAEFLVVFAYERAELRANRPSPNAAIREQLEADGVRAIDLYEPLRDAEFGSDSSYYYVTDIHWNTRGHQWIADQLRPWLLGALDQAPRHAPSEPN